QIATTVWMGFPDGKRKMKNVRGIAVTGGSFPAQIWKAFMERAMEGMPVEGFGKPSFEGEVLNESPTPSPSPSPSPTPSPTATFSLPPAPTPTPTKTNKPTPSSSPSPGSTGGGG
ncbi:MAG: transglycosylase domain-containing protein, partial [Actinomycetota bacterium]